MRKAYAKRLAIWPDIVQALEAGFPDDQALEIPIPKYYGGKLKDSRSAFEHSIRKLAGPNYRVRRKRDHLTVQRTVREIYHCSCGAKFLTTNGLERHNTSGVHERYIELRGILQDNCIRDVEIAREYGVSRERIRQLAQIVGLPPGRERRRACTLAHKPVKPDPQWLVNLRSVVEPMGLTVTRLVQGHRWRVLLNGVECAVGKLIQLNWQYRNRPPRIHMKLQCPKPMDYKFALMHSPSGWFIFPRFALPACGQTQFVLGELILPGTNSSRHHWRDYLERWDLVGGKVETEAAIHATSEKRGQERSNHNALV